MNERIKELADQASMYAVSDNSSMLFDVWKQRYTEKFAELIIKEYEQFLPEMCPWHKANENGPMKGWHVAFVARKHFGVE